MPTATTTRPKTKTAKPTTEARPSRTMTTTTNLLKLASDPTRLSVLLILLEGERHVGGLLEALGLTPSSQPALSHHISLMRHAGLIAPRRDGKRNYYALTEVGLTLANTVRSLAVPA